MDIKKTIKNLGKEMFAGSNITKGKAYHSFNGFEGNSHVGNVGQRVKLITDNYDVSGKHGIDFGCSVGGISIELARKCTTMSGYDHDHQAINVGQAYSDKENLSAFFNTTNINLEFIQNYPYIRNYPYYSMDFCIWFSHWMWFVKQHGIEDALNALWHLGKTIPVLFFETSLGDGKAGDVMKDNGIDESKMISILKNCYKSVKKIGVHESWRKRPIFMCEGCLPSEYKGYHNNKIERIGYNTITKKQSIEHCNKEFKYLQLLNNMNNHFPIIYSKHGDTILKMSYCGEPLRQLPSNWELQAEEILFSLKKFNIVHRDIIPRNLLVQDGKIKLIDFSWSGPPDEDTSKFPPLLGTDFKKYPGFNDRFSFDNKYSLYKSLKWIRDNENIS